MNQPERDAPSSSSMQLFSRRVKLSAGTLRHERGERVVAPMKRGLKVAVLLRGQQSYRLDDGPALTFTGPTVFVAANEGDHVQKRTFLTEEALSYAIVQIDTDFAESEFGASFGCITERMARKSDGPGLWVRSATPDLRMLASAMAECRIAGPMRGLYLGGKALELAAVVVDRLADERAPRPARLSPRMIEQLNAARALLLSSAQTPPSLAELARSTGLNVTKLTSGFRQLFGASVFAYLQEHRLQEAYELIRSGDKSVSEAAFHVGYNPAHFSGIFRKRFGVLPSSLR